MASVISYTKEKIDQLLTKINTDISGKSDKGHTHTMGQVDDLTDTLNKKSNNGHIHTIAQVDGLQAALEAGVTAEHRHKSSDITDAVSAMESGGVTLDKLLKSNARGTVGTNATSFENTDLVNRQYVDQKVGNASLWIGTVAEYNAIPTKDPSRAYIIVPD